MSLGAAIVVAAILVIAAWQIDKRGAWRKFGKGLLWVLGGIVALAVLVTAYVQWDDWSENRRKAQEVAAQLESLRTEGVSSYLNVRLGMTENEVKYVLGQPEDDGETEEKNARWLRFKGESLNGERFVFFDGLGVQRIVCAAEYSFDCPSLLGIDIGDVESVVLERLADTVIESEISDKGTKIVSAGPAGGRVLVWLDREKVAALGVSRAKQDEAQDSTDRQ